MRRLFAAIAGLGLLALVVPLIAQDNQTVAQPRTQESLMDTLARAAQLDADSQRSGLIGFVENQISTPDRQIRLTGIQGVLSSNASIAQITVSDTEGIYLIIENAEIVWNQAALIFARLEIQRLSAESIIYVRNPVSTESGPPPSPEAGGFSVPELPVAVTLDELNVPLVRFGEGVFGLSSDVSVTGSLSLAGGALDADLDITRLDGPGGQLLLDVAYANETQQVDLDLTLMEPENGIIANLLNIEGRPEVALSLAGEGRLTDLVTELAFDAGGSRVLSGRGLVASGAAGIAVDADLYGPIADILPAAYREFFGAESALAVDLLLRASGGVSVQRFALSGGQLALTGRAGTTADGFLSRLEVDGTVASADASPVLLPVPGASTRIDSARFSIDYGTQGGENWTSVLEVLGFANPDFSAERVVLNGGGVAANLEDPDSRRVTFNMDGGAEGIGAASAEIAEALGQSIGIGVAGLWEAGQPIELAQLRIMGEALTLDIAGDFEGAAFDGDIVLETANLAPFSGLAGRPLTGAARIAADGTIGLLDASFDLTLSGTATNLTLDEPMLDPLLAGEAALSGRVARSEAGLEADDLVLENPQVRLAADGTYATGNADFRFDAALADLALVSEDASGRVVATGTAVGTDGIIDLDARVTIAEGTLANRRLANAQLGFTGTTTPDGLTGAVSGTGFLDGFEIALASDIDVNDTRLALSDLSFRAPGASLAGNLTRDSENGLFAGRLTLDAPDIETAAALALIEAQGAVAADVTLAAEGGQQQASVSASVTALEAMDVEIGSARIEADIADLFGVPVIEGTINGRAIAAAGVTVETLNLAATASEETTAFNGAATLAGNTQIALDGSLAPVGDGFRVGLNTLSLTQGAIAARLAQPTALEVHGETVSFNGLTMNVGSGRISATGSAGSNLDIAVTVANLPLSIANTVAPGLGLAGTLSGSATVTGPASDPRAQFTIEGAGIDAAAIGEFGIAPLSFSANGSFANNTVTLASARASGAGGLNATASGTIPLEGNGLNLTVNGSAPLALANQFVAERGAALSGTATLDARVTGALANPQFSGTVSVAGGEYVDPVLNLRLTGITGSASLSGERAVINALSANLAGGGSVSVSGSVGLTGGMDANLAIALNSAYYTDGDLVAATLSGNLAVTGPVTAGPLISGAIRIERAEIAVPETFGANAMLIDVTHRNPPAAVAATLARLRTQMGGGSSTGGAGAPIRLDVTIEAPNQVFIRGRGLDAELGGSLRITGTTDNIIPVGGLELIRGRLEIIGQRIDFTTGTLTLVGDLDPFIDLVAMIQGEGITVYVTLSGQVSSPQIEFASTPMLPQDEVLSRLLFNRGIGELSPLQLAQLAAVAAQLVGGGGGPSFLDSIRMAAGLDDLDIVTDTSGNAAVRAGTYLQDNMYLSVEGGASGGRVSIDLDITNNLRARVSTGTDGNSSAGIFYEQDY